MKPLIPESIMKKITVSAAVLSLAGFFLFPWVQDWGPVRFFGIFNNPIVYGDSAGEIAAYAPILWLIPVGAILVGGLALVPFKSRRGKWVKWVFILLLGIMILSLHAWVTDAWGVRTLFNPALRNEWPGTLYDPWEKKNELIDKLVNQYNDVLGGESYPDHGFYISLAAGGVIVICSLVSLFLGRVTIVGQSLPAATNAPGATLIVFLFFVLLTGCTAPDTLPASLPTYPPTATSTLVVASTEIPEPAVTPTNLPTPLPVVFVWKITGDPNPFNAPVGVAIGPQGDIFVMDTKNARVQKFNSDGRYLSKWGSPGDGDGQFSIILPDVGRLVVDPQGNVYVIDHGNSRVQKFDAAGNFLTKWGTSGDGDSQFRDPSDIVIDTQNNVYVSDYLKSDVQKFDNNGQLLLRWQSPGSIYSLAIDPDGNILVADEAGGIRKYDTNGALLFDIRPKPIDNIAIELWNIAVDKQGNIYVADHNGIRIVKLDNRGEFLSTWRGGNTGAAMFDNLQDIAVDEQGNVYITDSASNLVQKFRQPAFLP